MARDIPSIMVTGSHIPFDRNGMKFYLPSGEISKEDERGIVAALEEDSLPPLSPEQFPAAPLPPTAGEAARDEYLQRYLSFFPPQMLAGQRLGIYQHSSVSRDILTTLCKELGAEVIALGRTDHFVPVDTEAVREEDVAQAKEWVAEHGLSAVLSTDGDGDRPLIFDERGECLRGDVIGLITARHLGATLVVTPVTSTTAIEQSGAFRHVERTQVGSPYVIAAMEKAGAETVIGFEANGGVLLGSPVLQADKALAALPTRDAVLPILCVLAAGFTQGKTLAGLGAEVTRATASDRIRDIDRPEAQALIASLRDNPSHRKEFFDDVGEVEKLCTVDGLRLTLKGGEIIHLRLSGNAPELRCYIDSHDAQHAGSLLRWGIKRLQDWLGKQELIP